MPCLSLLILHRDARLILSRGTTLFHTGLSPVCTHFPITAETGNAYLRISADSVSFSHCSARSFSMLLRGEFGKLLDSASHRPAVLCTPSSLLLFLFDAF